MATMEELSRTLSPTLAKQLAETSSMEAFGSDGPELDCDIDEIEEVAALAAQATFQMDGGRMLAAEAADRGLDQASRKAVRAGQLFSV